MSEQPEVTHTYGGDVGEEVTRSVTRPPDETPHVAVMAGLASASAGPPPFTQPEDEGTDS